jgi:hypothetical protein
MLKTVVQQMYPALLLGRSRLCRRTRCESLVANPDGNASMPRNQDWLIAEAGRSIRKLSSDSRHTSFFPSIATGKNIRIPAMGSQQLGQSDHDWSLPCSAGR